MKHFLKQFNEFVNTVQVGGNVDGEGDDSAEVDFTDEQKRFCGTTGLCVDDNFKVISAKLITLK